MRKEEAAMGRRTGINEYELLANAIVLQAVKDYRRAARKISGDRQNIMAERTYRDCRRFFLSRWMQVLTDVDGRELIRKLDREVER